tara:strand:- start:203 stop:817 length:615 start_codon:yes stop_codon:yes gene_type:complete
MLVFGTYEYLKQKLLLKYDNKIGVYMLSASIADLLGGLWLSPYELIKQKKQSGIINNTINGIKYIYMKEGLIGFYKGFSVLLCRDIPYRAIKLPLYEIITDYYIPKKRKIYMHESLLIGTTIGMFSSAITNPADFLKTRIMTSNESKINIKDFIKNIINKEGYSIFLTGIRYRTFYTGISNGIFFSFFELIRNNEFILNSYNLK